MILKTRPTKSELKDDKPDFWVITDKPWNHKDNTSQAKKLLTWLIWNASFDIKERTRYLIKNSGLKEALFNLIIKLHKQGFKLYLDTNIFMVWKG